MSGNEEAAFATKIQQEMNEAAASLHRSLLREQRSPEYNAERDLIAKTVNDARFDERVACAALLLQEFSEIPGNMANRSVLIEMASNVAKAILARGKS